VSDWPLTRKPERPDGSLGASLVRTLRRPNSRGSSGKQQTTRPADTSATLDMVVRFAGLLGNDKESTYAHRDTENSETEMSGLFKLLTLSTRRMTLVKQALSHVSIRFGIW